MNPLMLGFLVLMVLLMFFMNSRQRRAQQAQKERMNTMQPGDNVVTIGGLHGVLSTVSADQKTVDIDCEGVVLTFEKSAIRSFTSAGAATAPAQEAAAGSDEVGITSEEVKTEADNKVESPIEEGK